MVLFFICVACLVAGYFIYGALMEKIFVIKPERQTPAYAMGDGVDYVPMSRTKVWLIQVLNIAGTGPIFGPILGAVAKIRLMRVRRLVLAGVIVAFQGIEGLAQAALAAADVYMNGDEGGERQAVRRPDVHAMRPHAEKLAQAGKTHEPSNCRRMRVSRIRLPMPRRI